MTYLTYKRRAQEARQVVYNCLTMPRLLFVPTPLDRASQTQSPKTSVEQNNCLHQHLSQRIPVTNLARYV